MNQLAYLVLVLAEKSFKSKFKKFLRKKCIFLRFDMLQILPEIPSNCSSVNEDQKH